VLELAVFASRRVAGFLFLTSAGGMPRSFAVSILPQRRRLFMKLRVLLVILVAVLSGNIFAQEALAENLRECVTEYDPDVDYFPEKAVLTHAETFTIEYFNHYKVITVTTPWYGASDADAFQYVLVQCGTPVPEGFENAQVIEAPAADIISMSTAQLPQIVELGLLDHLIGVDNFAYINTPEVLEKIEAGELIEVGNGASVNAELVLEAEPSIVMVNANGVAEYDAHPALLEAGVFVAINADWVEPTLLGRAEWVKFLAAFYNAEGEAEALFDDMVTQYEEAKALVAELPEDERVTVLWNSYQPFTTSWSIPGQQTWLGELLRDAGVNWVLMEEAPEESAQLSFEQVYEAGVDTPVWVLNTFGIATLDDLIASDERYADFAAVEDGLVYDNSARINESGFNDFWETGVTHPHLILKDLIAMFYPELLPDHEMMFYNQLQ
jgi:iron complex transport system substrate-binding protein